jgi:hypothetical protein
MSEQAYGGTGGGTLLEEFFVKLGVKADHGAVEKFQHAISGVHHALEALGILAAIEVGRRIVEFVENAVAGAADIEHVSEAIDMAATSVAAFDRVAASGGISASEMNDALVSMTRAAGAAAAGFPRYAKLFKQLGIDTKDAATGALKTTEDLFAELADKFAQWDPGMRLAVAGRLGINPRLASLMANMGGDEFLGSVKEAKKSDLLTDADYKLAHETEITFARIKKIVAQVTALIGIELAPVVLRVADAFEEWWKVNRQDVLTRFTDWLWIVIHYALAIYRGAVDVKDAVAGWLEPFSDIISPLQIIETVVVAIVAVKLAAWIYVVAAALATLAPVLGPITLVLLGLLGIVSIASQLRENWNPIMQWFGEKWDWVKDKARDVFEFLYRGSTFLRPLLKALGITAGEDFLDRQDQRHNDERTLQSNEDHLQQRNTPDYYDEKGDPVWKLNYGLRPKDFNSSMYAPRTAPLGGAQMSSNTKVDIARVDIHADKGREGTVGAQLNTQIEEAINTKARPAPLNLARNAQGYFKS